MSSEQGTALAPVVGWTSSTITAYGAAFFTLEYLVSPMESAEQAHKSPNFLLSTVQLRELGQRMLFLADELERNPPTSAGSPQH